MTDAGDAPSGGGKMLLIIGLVVGLLVGGGGAFFILQNAPKAPPPGDEGAEEAEPKIEKAPETLFSVKLERVAVPIYSEDDGRRKFLGNYFVDIQIQTETEPDQIRVRQSEARLRHAFIDAISKPGLMQEDNPLQIDAAKARGVFLARAARIVGDDVIYDIAITNSVRVSG